MLVWFGVKRVSCDSRVMIGAVSRFRETDLSFHHLEEWAGANWHYVYDGIDLGTSTVGADIVWVLLSGLGGVLMQSEKKE